MGSETDLQPTTRARTKIEDDLMVNEGNAGSETMTMAGRCQDKKKSKAE